MYLVKQHSNWPVPGMVYLAVVALATAATAGTAASARPSNDSPTPTIPDLAALGVFEKVYFQTTSDGVIHAKGSNYKAMFSSESVTYHPRGGEAMTFTLASTTVGGQPLPFDAEAIPTREGDTISIDRGAFIEHYALTHHTIEQLFTIDQLPARGDLVLRIAADAPDMMATVKSDGLEFKSVQTEVTYSKAVLLDSAGTRTGLSTQIANGVIEIRVNGSTLDRAAFPITIDPVISNSTPFTYFSHSYDNPDVAFDATHNRFVLAAEFEYSATDGDIYSILLDASGMPIPNTFDYVDLTGVNWRNPQVANNNIANSFMVVAEHGLEGERGIWGCMIDPATGAEGTQFWIAPYDGKDKTNPDIGGDSSLAPPTHFLVVWEHAFSEDDHDIHGRMMNANGTAVDDAFVLDIALTNQSIPSVSKSNRGSQWMAVWQTTVTASNDDIWGARVNWNGTVTLPAQAVNEDAASHKRPQVSSPMAGQFLIIYEKQWWSLQLHLVNSNMTTLDFSSLVDLGNDVFGMGRLYPTVDADGSKFVIGYSEMWDGGSGATDLYADTICAANGSLRLAEHHKYLAFTGSFSRHITVATSWSAGGAAMGPALFAWLRDTGGTTGQVGVAGYDAPVSCCPADIAPVGGDGTINVLDLLAVINQWDNTGWCFDCTADITSDFFVNVPDLLKVINAWGACQ